MAIVQPTPITALPTPPQSSDPGNFDTRADAFLGQLPTTRTEMNSLGTNLYNNASEVVTVANNAITVTGQNVSSAQAAADLAQTSANFKGSWSSLTGALNKPASVLHNNKYWLLLNDLTNVTTSQPGVSSDWSPVIINDPVTTVTGGIIDCSKGQHFIATVSANTTFTLTNVPTGAYEFQLLILHTAGTITLPSNLVFAGASPTFTTNKRHLVFGTKANLGTSNFLGSAIPGYPV